MAENIQSKKQEPLNIQGVKITNEYTKVTPFTIRKLTFIQSLFSLILERI